MGGVAASCVLWASRVLLRPHKTVTVGMLASDSILAFFIFPPQEGSAHNSEHRTDGYIERRKFALILCQGTASAVREKFPQAIFFALRRRGVSIAAAPAECKLNKAVRTACGTAEAVP